MPRFAPLLLLALAAAGPADRTARLERALALVDAGRGSDAKRLLGPLAAEGSAVAETLIGIVDAQGRAGRARPDLAALHFYRAAERGYPPAQLALAELLVDGRGTPASPRAALRWALVAKRLGAGPVRARAAALASQLADKLGPAETDRAERRAARWRPWDATIG